MYWEDKKVYWVLNKKFLYPNFKPVLTFELGINSTFLPVAPGSSDLIYSESINEKFRKTLNK